MALTDRTVLRNSPEDKAAWEAAAARAERKLADWIRLMLNSAATVQGVSAGRQHEADIREICNEGTLHGAPIDRSPRPSVQTIAQLTREFKPDFKPPSKKKGRRA